jgi:hypothetical protein
MCDWDDYGEVLLLFFYLYYLNIIIYLFFKKNCIFPKYHIFQLLEKKIDVERKIVGENFEKREM